MAANRDAYFADGSPDIGFESHSTVNVPTSEEPTESSSSGHTRMKPRPGTKRKTSKASLKSGRKPRTGNGSFVDRIRSHHHHHNGSGGGGGGGGHGSNRDIEARRRKERIRRRKRKRNRCAILEKLIDRLERQPEVESHSLFGVTCRDVSYFVILFSVVLFLRSAISLYTQSVLEQIQLRYILATSELDLIKGTETIGFVVTLIFVGFFGRRCHKPLLMTCGVIVLALGAIIWPVPYFVTSTGMANMTTNSCSSKPNPNGVDVPPTFYGQLCQVGSKNSSSPFESCSSCLKDKNWVANTDMFVHIIYLAGFLIGFGTGLFLTTGTLYIEAAKRQKDSPLQYGFLFFMNGLGEFLGSAFAWWFLNYPENLKAGSPLYPWSIRAWWLGMVIFSVLLFLLSFSFLFFPKWIVEPSWSIARRHARLMRLTKLLDAAKRDRQKRREKMKRDKMMRQKRERGAKGDASAKSAGAKASRNANVYVGDINRGVVTDDDGAAETEVPFPSMPDDGAADGANSSDTETEENNGDAVVVNRHKTTEEQAPGRANKGVKFGAVTDLSGADPVVPDPIGQGHRSSKSPRGPAVERKDTDKRDKVSQVLTECFTAAWGLVSMPTYLLAVVSATLSAYLPGGYRTDVARFVHTQYHYDLSSSIFYADGLCYSLAHAGGGLLGGYIVWKMRLSLPQQLRLIICALAINIVFFFIIFSVGCWNEGNQWQNSSAINSGVDDRRCVKDCDCSSVQFVPVCSADGARFTSPCDAGCTSLQLRDSNLVYMSCSCVVGGATVASEVSSSFCSTCSAFGAFWILLFLSIVSYSTAYVSILLVFLRIVEEEKRQLSLSLAVWIIALGAYVPGTAVFRGIESSSCRKWSTDCLSESVCLFNDVNHLRYNIHGTNIAFQAAAVAGFILILFFLKELNPCSRQSTSDRRDLDLDPGQDRPRRNSTKIATAAPSAVILLGGSGGGGEMDGNYYEDSLDGPGSSSVAERNGDLHVPPGSYVSPVFEMDDDMRGSWNAEGSWAVEGGLDEGQGMARVNGNVVEFDRMSGESFL